MYITVEENIRIEFDRFFDAVKYQNCDIEEKLRDMLTILEENIIQEYNGQSDEIFTEGYDEGRDHGFDSGFEEGFEEGKDQGHDEGYQQGLEDGNDDGYKIGYAEAIKKCNCKKED